MLDMEHDTVTYGTHHVISPKMHNAYVSEFQLRYNNRKSVVHLFDLLLSRVSSLQVEEIEEAVFIGGGFGVLWHQVVR